MNIILIIGAFIIGVVLGAHLERDDDNKKDNNKNSEDWINEHN